MESVLVAAYIVAVVFFWLLAFRLLAALLKLNPYNPNVQFLFRITEPLIRPFRRLRRRPSRVDPALLIPMIILLLIILLLGLRFW